MSTNPTLRDANEPRLVVCIGASGGSPRALEELVARLPVDTGMAFVLGG